MLDKNDSVDSVSDRESEEVMENHDSEIDHMYDMETEEEMSEDDSADIEIDTGIDVAAGEVKEFTVDGFNFGYSMSEIRVKQGDTVTINLTSSDGFHDWVVDEFDAATDKIREGETTSVTFVADQAGSFEYYCSVGSHRANGMVGTLIVE